MHTVLYLTKAAFRKGGPLHRLMAEHTKEWPVEYRASQAQTAEWYAEYLDAQSSAQTGTPRRPEVALGQIEPGVGKTLAYSIPLAFYVHERDKRALVSTYTIDLRNNIALPDQVALVNKVVAETYRELGLTPPLGRPISFGIRISFTAFASLHLARIIAEEAINNAWPADARRHAIRYFAYVRNAYKRVGRFNLPIQFGEHSGTQIFQHSAPSMTAWLSRPSSRGRMPSDPSQGPRQPSDYKLLPPEIKLLAKYGVSDLDIDTIRDGIALIRSSIDAFIETDDAQAVDVTVCTHAMLLTNNRIFGQCLDTRRLHPRVVHGRVSKHSGLPMPGRRIGALMIDEADLISDLAENSTDMKVTFEHIEQALSTLRRHGVKIGALRRCYKAVEALKDVIIQENGRNPSPGRLLSFELDSGQEALIFAITKFREVFQKALDAVQTDLGFGDAVDIVSIDDVFDDIQTLYAGRNKSNGESILREDTVTMMIAMIEQPSRGGDPIIPIGLGTKPQEGATLLSRTWINHKTHSFESIAMVSGTLDAFEKRLTGGRIASSLPTFEVFRQRVNLSHSKASVYKKSVNVAAHGHGEIGRLLYTEPALNTYLTPTLDKGVSRRIEENQSLDYTNPAHTEYVAKCVIKAAYESWGKEEEVPRALVLFASTAALRACAKRIGELDANVAARLIVQADHVPASFLVDRFLADPAAIWMGMNFHGVNFVEAGVTLVGRILITKAPVAIMNDLKASLGSDREFARMFEQAAAKIIQGSFRGIRSAKDRPDVWLLDPRLPLPAAMHSWCDGLGIEIVPTRPNGKKAPTTHDLWVKVGECLPKRVLAKARLGLLRLDTPDAYPVIDEMPKRGGQARAAA